MVRILVVTMRFLLVPLQVLTSPTPPRDGSHGLMVRILVVTMIFLLVPFQGLTSPHEMVLVVSW